MHGHPLDGKTFILLNVFDIGGMFGNNGLSNMYIGLQESDLSIRADYIKQKDAMPIKFHKIEGMPDSYTLQSQHPNIIGNWISQSEGSYKELLAKTKNVLDAMPIRMIKRLNNNKGTCPGEQYAMQYLRADQHFVSS